MANDKGTETVCSARRGGEWQLHFDRFGYVERIYFFGKIVTPLCFRLYSSINGLGLWAILLCIIQLCKIRLLRHQDSWCGDLGVT